VAIGKSRINSPDPPVFLRASHPAFMSGWLISIVCDSLAVAPSFQGTMSSRKCMLFVYHIAFIAYDQSIARQHCVLARVSPYIPAVPS
jgi:hypothetical protein